MHKHHPNAGRWHNIAVLRLHTEQVEADLVDLVDVDDFRSYLVTAEQSRRNYK